MFGGQLDKISLQKLLFLFTDKQIKADYDFIPYKYGCYSHSANADMTAMVTRGFLTEDEKHFAKKDPTDYIKQLKPADLIVLREVKANYSNMNASALMKHTYLNFPFYAIKSEVASTILSKSIFEKSLAPSSRAARSTTTQKLTWDQTFFEYRFVQNG